MRRRLPALFLIIAALMAVFGTLAFYWPDVQWKPLFARVTFGSDLGQPIWFVAKGSRLYLDRNANDGVQPAEYLGQTKVELPIEFTTANGKTVYRNISVGLQLAPDALNEQRRQKLFFDVDIHGDAQFRQTGLVEMTELVDEAATLQVDSLLQLRMPEQGCPTELVAGGESAEVRVEVVTVHADARATISLDTKATLDQPTSANSKIEVPVVEIVFPVKNLTTDLAVRFTLDELC